MNTVAILSTETLPGFLGSGHPTEAGLFAEDDCLIAALSQRGIEARRVPWRAFGDVLEDHDLALIRSTWDYIDDVQGFLALLARIEASPCRLVNALDSVLWNIDKAYLFEMAERGITVVPTEITRDPKSVIRGDSGGLSASKEIVVKPTVGVGAFGVTRYKLPRLGDDTDLPDFDEGDYMIQPFLTSVIEEGEWSFVYFNAELAYSVLKKPAKDDFRVQVMYAGRNLPARPDPTDVEAADRVMASLPVAAGYARVDMARLPDGQLALMEVELIEPQLFLSLVPQSAPLLARAIERWMP